MDLFALDILVLLHFLEVVALLCIQGILVLLCVQEVLVLLCVLEVLVLLVPETSGYKSLDETEESEDAHSYIMMGKEASVSSGHVNDLSICMLYNVQSPSLYKQTED